MPRTRSRSRAKKSSVFSTSFSATLKLRDEIVEEIRKRGIGFPLTDGMRSLVATKSGNDALTAPHARRSRTAPRQSSRVRHCLRKLKEKNCSNARAT